jgi:phosphopantetheinyl transferase
VDLSSADLEIVARSYLHTDEMEEFRNKAEAPQRQRQWLLGRIVAKDAIRALLAASTSGPRDIHPASLIIVYDESRCPLVDPGTLPGLRQPVPSVSIAHCRDRAVAIADHVPVGVDLEHIVSRDDAFRETAFTPSERILLEQAAQGLPPALDEWVTRVWCAKEATRKLRGGRPEGSSRRLEVIAILTDGVVEVRVAGEQRTTRVKTVRDGDYIFACCS